MFDDIIANSARQAAEISRLMDEKNQREAEHRAKLEAGAEADIAQKELLQRQLEALREQNGLLSENYKKLKEMYDSQVEANETARNDLKSSRKFNAWMMVIAIIAMLAAIAGPIATILVSR
ncbi:MAG: hypothetical protein ACI4GA_05940 [Acutalibacteraceae bacterium]